MSRRKATFEQLQTLIKADDYTTINHILRFEYNKEQLFGMRNDEGLSLVHIACLEGKLKCLDNLLRNGGSPHAKSSVGWTPLHAATLGGNVEVVSYLLFECSADPLALDDMNCLSSDLTMDDEILNILNEHAENETVKKDIEALASQMSLTDKRRTVSYNVIPPPPVLRGRLAARAKSMFVNKEEALQIRIHYTKQNSIKNDDNKVVEKQPGLLRIPNMFCVTGDSNSKNSKVTRHHSDTTPESKKTVNSFRFYSDSSDARDLHNAEVLRIKSESSPSSPQSPKAYRFITRDTTGRSREMRNRDSGVFDDEIETDLAEQLGNTSGNDLHDHYHVI